MGAMDPRGCRHSRTLAMRLHRQPRVPSGDKSQPWRVQQQSQHKTVLCTTTSPCAAAVTNKLVVGKVYIDPPPSSPGSKHSLAILTQRLGRINTTTIRRAGNYECRRPVHGPACAIACRRRDRSAAAGPRAPTAGLQVQLLKLHHAIARRAELYEAILAVHRQATRSDAEAAAQRRRAASLAELKTLTDRSPHGPAWREYWPPAARGSRADRDRR